MARYVSQVREARKRLRRALIEAQGNLCGICGLPMDPDHHLDRPGRATLDHVFPQRNGGTDATCLAVHSKCNNDKGGRKPTGCEILTLEATRAVVLSSPRLTELVTTALTVLGNAPSWARYGRVEPCSCSECQQLDQRYPGEGKQLLLPILRH